MQSVRHYSHYQKLALQSRLTPCRVVVVDADGTETSARQLLLQVERRAALLAASSHHSRFVILAGGASAACFSWMIAAWTQKRVVVPVDGSLPQARMDAIVTEVRRVDPNACFIQGNAPIIPGEQLATWEIPAPHEPAIVLFTSGSTGIPKGVVLSYENLTCATCERPSSAFWRLSRKSILRRRGSAEALLNYASFSNAIHLNHVTAAASGHTVVCVSPLSVLDIDHMVYVFHRYRIRRVALTPSFCQRAIASPEWFQTLDALYLYGEPTPDALVTTIREALPHIATIQDLYGQTEGTQWFATRDLLGDSVWKPAPGVSLSINGGTLWVRNRSPQALFQGYLGQPERSHDALFCTGDRVEGTATRFRLTGRADTMRKVRGYRVELSEIEAALTGLSGVLCAVVITRDQLVGYVTSSAEETPFTDSASVLLNGLAECLPAYAVPSQIRFVNELPLLENHKINRELLKTWADTCTTIKSTPKGADDTVTQLFRHLFPDAGPLNDASSFQALGGHSLLVMEAVIWLRRACAVPELAPAELMRLDTIGAIRDALGLQPTCCTPTSSAAPVYLYPRRLPSLRHCVRHPITALKDLQIQSQLKWATSFTVPIARHHTDIAVRNALTKLTALHPVLRSQSAECGSITIASANTVDFLQPIPRLLRFLWGARPGHFLFRAERLSKSVVRMNVHHRIADNESCDIIARDFRALLLGHTLADRAYGNLQQAREQILALPTTCRYDTPPITVPDQAMRHGVHLVVRTDGDSAALLPILVIAFSCAMGGPVTVPVLTDARYANNLLNVDTTQLVSFLVVSREVTANPNLTPAGLRSLLDAETPRYSNRVSSRGFSNAVSPVVENTCDRPPPTGEINMQLVRQGHAPNEGLHFFRTVPTFNERRRPRIVSLFAQYYLQSQRMLVLALGPSEDWAHAFASACRNLGQGTTKHRNIA